VRGTHSLLAAAEPAGVDASNAAETTTKVSMVPSTVYPVLGFAVLSNSRLAQCLLASADPCGVEDELEVGVAIAVQPLVLASVVQVPQPIALHLQAPIILEELAKPHESHPRVARQQHRRHIEGLQCHLHISLRVGCLRRVQPQRGNDSCCSLCRSCSLPLLLGSARNLRHHSL